MAGATKRRSAVKWNHPVSHAQIKFPMQMKFETVATVLALRLVFQVQADTLAGQGHQCG
jgi:hypothetical protein